MGNHVARPQQGSGFLRHGRIWRRLRLVDELLVSHNSTVSGAGARITKLGVFAALMLTAAGASCGVDARAADIIPTTTSATPASAPKSCTSLWDFIATNCPLAWQGITIYGTVDAGGGWQSHGAPLDSRSAPGASYLIEKTSRSSQWSLAPNALSTSTIGIKGTEPIGGHLSAVFAPDAASDTPSSVRLHGHTV